MLFTLIGFPWRLALDLTQGAVIALVAATQTLLLLAVSHRVLTLLRAFRTSRDGRARTASVPVSADTASAHPSADPAPLPVVTVQLPVYNERVVVERAIRAAAALRYPPDRLEIQVLDDSTDETTALAARAVERLRAVGHDVHLLHRDARDGFKAGALAAGLERARGELIAVFDADFLPPPEFLERIVPRFADPGIGMVQARWGHLNRDTSRLTAAQACLLDAHFLLDHVARHGGGLFFNFNGTAGVWRRRCIQDAGGWTHDTLTEDLDLSYRAQLAGWRFDLAEDVVAPAEVPSDLASLQTQQHRWVKGSIQTARKLLPAVRRARLPLRVGVEACVHLTINACYPLTLIAGLLLGPCLLLVPDAPPWIAGSAVAWAGVIVALVFMAAGQRRAGRPFSAIARDVPMAMVLVAGLSLVHTRAVLEGLGRERGDWRRTPKRGDGGATSGAALYRPPRPGFTGERLLALYFAALTPALAGTPWSAGLTFALLLAAGLGYVGLREARVGRARGSVVPSERGGIRSA